MRRLGRNLREVNLDHAHAFNRTCPPGSLVVVAMRDGSTRTAKLRAPAFVWSGLALVELVGLPGYYTVQAVRPHVGVVGGPASRQAGNSSAIQGG